MDFYKCGRLIAGFCAILSLGATENRTTLEEPAILWTQHISSRLASRPHLIGEVLWVPLVKGGIDARSIEDGSRLFRLKTPKEVELFPLSEDSLCAVRFGEDARIWLLANNPPHLLREIEMPLRLIDLDVYGSDISLLLSGPVVNSIIRGRMQQPKPLQLTGTGWSDIHVIDMNNGMFDVLVGRREGSIAKLTTSGSIDMMFRLDGGIEHLVRNGTIVLFGRDGMVVRAGIDMKPLWMRDLSASLQTDPVYREDEAWIPLRNRTMVRFSMISGNISFIYDLPGPLACPPVIIGDRIAFSAERGIVTIIIDTDPESVMTFDVGDRITGLAGDHRFLFVATDHGDIICYSLN